MFTLDPVPSYCLRRPPLIQAFGQVKFATRAKLGAMDGIVPVQEQLDQLFPYMKDQQVQQLALVIGAASSSMPTAKIWHFYDNHGWAADISPDSATLSIGIQYRDFREFLNVSRCYCTLFQKLLV